MRLLVASAVLSCAVSARSFAGDCFDWPTDFNSNYSLGATELDYYSLDNPAFDTAAPLYPQVFAQRSEVAPYYSDGLEDVIDLLNYDSPDGVYGTYISGVHIRSSGDVVKYPVENVLYGDVSTPLGDYIFTDPFVHVDCTDVYVPRFIDGVPYWYADLIRDSIVDRLATDSFYTPSFVMLDNTAVFAGGGMVQPTSSSCTPIDCWYHPIPGGCSGPTPTVPCANCDVVPWSTLTTFLGYLRDDLHEECMALVPNAVVLLGDSDFTIYDMNDLVDNVDGIMLEQAFHKNGIRNNVTNFEREVSRQQEILKDGKLVVWYPTQGFSLSGCANNAAYSDRAEERALAGIAMLVRRTDYRLFVVRGYRNYVREWKDWPGLMGAELEADPHQVTSSPMVYSRMYASGMVVVNVSATLCAAESPCAVRLIRYGDVDMDYDIDEDDVTAAQYAIDYPGSFQSMYPGSDPRIADMDQDDDIDENDIALLEDAVLDPPAPLESTPPGCTL